MTGAFRWLRLETVIAIHGMQISEHGGSVGVRELGLLKSALDRPRNLHAYGTQPDIADLAAALAFGIVRNHPFVDGNKRNALVCMRTFLIQNGSDLVASQEEKFVMFWSLAEGRLNEIELADWIRTHLHGIQEEFDYQIED